MVADLIQDTVVMVLHLQAVEVVEAAFTLLVPMTNGIQLMVSEEVVFSKVA